MRNKKIADMLVIILAVAFIISFVFEIHLKNNFFVEMLNFVIEAALVGSIADWFAVTALFKKPLGFPFHTAIIPKNRDKVVEAAANVVEVELLSEDTLKSKIDKIDITGKLIEFLDKSFKEDSGTYDIIKKYVIKIIDSIDTGKVSKFIENNLKNKLDKTDLSIYIQKILEFLIKNEEFKKLFQSLCDELIIKVKSKKVQEEIYVGLSKIIHDNIKSTKGIKGTLMKLGLKIGQKTDSVNIFEAAVSIQNEIVNILIELKDENSSTYKQIMHEIEGKIEKLLLSEDAAQLIKKVDIHIELKEFIDNVLNSFKCNMENYIYKYFQYFKNDSRMKNIVEIYIKEFIYKIIRSEHGFIGKIVREVLESMSDESLNDFIQSKAGNSLHWIRINGCIIGAISGLIVFLIINEIYLPYVQNFIYK